MSTVQTPNMGLNLPVVSEQSGPQFATDINQAFSQVDYHNHSVGQGVSITPGGININSDLGFNGYNATGLRTVRFTPSTASSGTDVGAIYVAGQDLYYNNTLGQVIKITTNGAVSQASSGNIQNLVSPASVVYSSSASKFTFQSDVNVPANLDVGAIQFRRSSSAGPDFKISAATSATAPITMQFPASLPTTGTVMVSDSSGRMGFGVPAMGNNGYALAPSTSFTTTSTVFVDVPQQSIVLVGKGRPLQIMILPGASSANPALLSVNANANDGMNVKLTRNSLDIATFSFNNQVNNIAKQVPPPGVIALDNPATSTYTYSLQVASVGGTVVNYTNCYLTGYEV